MLLPLVPSKDISCIHFIPNVPKLIGPAIGNNDIADCFKFFQIADDTGTEKVVFLQRRFIDDDFNPLGFNTLHDALDGRGPEVVRVTLHGQPIDADDLGILRDDHIGDMVFSRPVGGDDGRNQVLGHILIVR